MKFHKHKLILPSDRFRLPNIVPTIRRGFSDKSKKNDKIKPNEKEKEKSQLNETNEINQKQSLNKIQSLLKAIIEDNKIKAKQSKPKFAQATDVIKRRIRSNSSLPKAVDDTDENLTKAASQVAKDMGGDVKQTEAELLSRILGKVSAPTSLNDLMAGMKIYRGEEPEKVYKRSSRGDQVKQLISRVEHRKSQPSQAKFNIRGRDRLEPGNDRKPIREHAPIDPFNGEPLNIFTLKGPADYGNKPDVWSNLEQRDLKLAISQPPANYYYKIAGWTEQGKVWKFPIDNEQGLDGEKNVHFSEHIFLESHLEDWPLFRGSVRHFMELVCVGLSKNPYYTVEEKKEHIMWFKEYFDSKSKLLNEIGAFDRAKNTDMPASN